MRGEIRLSDPAATHAFARRLAGLLRAGDVIGLSGPLGSGKTELARALIRARAGARIEVPSPSFTLVQDYPLPGLSIRHADLFRVGDPSEVIELGLDEAVADGALIVEWPEHAASELPADRLDIRLDQGDAADARILTLRAGPSWRDRLPALLDDRA